jgi:hypothetical protein
MPVGMFEGKTPRDPRFDFKRSLRHDSVRDTEVGLGGLRFCWSGDLNRDLSY